MPVDENGEFGRELREALSRHQAVPAAVLVEARLARSRRVRDSTPLELVGDTLLDDDGRHWRSPGAVRWLRFRGSGVQVEIGATAGEGDWRITGPIEPVRPVWVGVRTIGDVVGCSVGPDGIISGDGIPSGPMTVVIEAPPDHVPRRFNTDWVNL